MHYKKVLQLARKLIENARIAIDKKLERNCQIVLGDETDVGEISHTWDRNSERFQIIGTHLMLDFIQKGSRSADEIDLYKKAIGDFGAFMQRCSVENKIDK